MNFIASLLACAGDQGFQNLVEDAEAPVPQDIQDRFKQEKAIPVDGLFVIDDSGSMSGSQDRLASNLRFFTDTFMSPRLDYHLGVITTDMADDSKKGQLQPAYDFSFVDSYTQDVIDAEALTDDYGLPLTAQKVFTRMATPGVEGSGTEMGLQAVHYSLNYYQGIDTGGFPEANHSFFRDEAALHIVLISDEEDHSTEITADGLTTELQALQDQGKTVAFHSIVGINDNCEENGTAYLSVTDQVGGLSYPICESLWETMLTDIGLEGSGLLQEFELSMVPLDGTIEVEVSYEDPVGSGHYESYFPDVGSNEFSDLEFRGSTNTLTFRELEDIPPPEADIYVNYQSYQDWEEAE